jgi:hypothetical protein
MSKRLLLIAPCLASALTACRSADPFEGLAPAQQTGGPRIVFDLTRKPFPEVPFPNDILTRVDPSSPTGVRLNSSIVAPTQLERDLHSRLDFLDGFGTFAPITVAFDADLDVADLLASQNDPNPANRAVHLVEIATGNEVPLDFGVGPHSHFPDTLPNPAPYFVADPFADETNLLFPTRGPFANLLNPLDPAFPASHGNVAQQDEDLLEFYERSTHTLILRPVVPLRQESRYAVLLTSRLRDTQKRSVVAPGSGINHPAQTNELRPLLAHLPPGVQLSNIAYAWAFTTQSVTRELEAIAQGLNVTGGLLILSTQYPVQVSAPEIAQNAYRTLMLLTREHDAGNVLDPKDIVYRLTPSELLAFLADPAVAPLFGSPGPAQVQALAASFRYVDYFVSGAYTSPSFLDATDQSPQDTSFAIDLTTGTARVVGRLVPFFLAVPKKTALHQPPFAPVIVGHGFGSSRAIDMLAFAGTFAKFGLASVSIDAFGHGIAVDPATAAAVHAAGASRNIGSFADAILAGRARDLDNDGIADPGGDYFGAQLFHARDALRQTTADWLQLAKLLHSFDGTGQFLFAPNPGGQAVYSVAGDFNGDGIPDLGGLPAFPNATNSNDGNPTANPPVAPSISYPKGAANPGSDVFVFGESLGGILTGLYAAVDPSIRGAVAVSGGGGLTDIGLRTNLAPVVNAVFLNMFGPFVVTCPYSAALGRCAPGEADAQPTLVMVVADLTRERDLPVARLALQPGDKVSVRNLRQVSATAVCSGDPLQGCATGTADANGNVRVAFSADSPTLSVPSAGTPGPVTVLSPGDALQIEISGSTTRTINTFGFDTTFYGLTYRTGDPLSAPARGYGRTRNTPGFRRLVQIAQTVLEPADPINYAPYYSQNEVLRSRAGQGRVPTLVVGTVGDPSVPTSTAISLARAAGLVEMTQPDPAYGLPIDQVLIESGVVEGAARTQRFASPSFGPRVTLGTHVRCDAGADCTGNVLLDPSGYSCDATGANCTDGLNAPRLNPPLREQLLRPVIGTAAFSGLLLPYLSRTGQHGFSSPQPQKQFDMDRFLANLIGRYFETRGREVRFDACQAAEPADPAPECPWMAPPPP